LFTRSADVEVGPLNSNDAVVSSLHHFIIRHLCIVIVASRIFESTSGSVPKYLEF